jgi:hypothetical protein
MHEFEKGVQKFRDIFQFYHFLKFKEIMKDEDEKKYDTKKSENRNTTNISASI